jgi:hypothetical protein
MKRTTKKTREERRQLQLDTTTVKVLTNQDFVLVNGCGIVAAKSAYCGTDD